MKNFILDFDFENYKVNFCKNPVCKFSSDDLAFPSYTECFDHHNSEDRRRKVLIFENSFNYSPKYYYDSNDNNNPYCKNSFEYYYHPLNYKSKKCLKDKCNELYCPYYHKNEEKEYFENYRKKLENIRIQTFFDNVVLLCQQANECLKISESEPEKKKIDESPITLYQTQELVTKKTESISSTMVFFIKNIFYY